MFIISNRILTIAKIADLLITLYIIVVIVRVILSWVPHNQYSSLVRFVHNVTEPLLIRIRRFVPLLGGFDLSPMILIFGLYIIESFVVQTLHDLAMAIR